MSINDIEINSAGYCTDCNNGGLCSNCSRMDIFFKSYKDSVRNKGTQQTIEKSSEKITQVLKTSEYIGNICGECGNISGKYNLCKDCYDKFKTSGEI